MLFCGNFNRHYLEIHWYTLYVLVENPKISIDPYLSLYSDQVCVLMVCTSCVENCRWAVWSSDVGLHSGGHPAARDEDFRDGHRKSTHACKSQIHLHSALSSWLDLKMFHQHHSELYTQPSDDGDKSHWSTQHEVTANTYKSILSRLSVMIHVKKAMTWQFGSVLFI